MKIRAKIRLKLDKEEQEAFLPLISTWQDNPNAMNHHKLWTEISKNHPFVVGSDYHFSYVGSELSLYLCEGSSKYSWIPFKIVP